MSPTDNLRLPRLKVGIAISACWFAVCALGMYCIVSYWSSHQNPSRGWYSAALFFAVMSTISIAGFLAYAKQGREARAERATIPRGYKASLQFGIILQGILVMLAALLLDGGRALHICVVAVPAYWAMVGLMFYLRPANPTTTDLVLVRYGYFLMTLVVGQVGTILWRSLGLW